MARSARHTFQELGIPESDPAWDHIRNSAETNRKHQASAFDSVGFTSEGNTKLEAHKRGVSSQEVREKKAKQKQKLNPKAEIMMKDESLKVNSRLSQTGVGDGETPQMKGMQSTSRENLTTCRNQGDSSQKSAKYGLKRSDGEISQIASSKAQNIRSLTTQDDEPSLVGKLPASDREGKNFSSEVVRKRRDKGPEPSDSEREGRHLQSDMDKARVVREEGTRIDQKSSQSKRKTANRDDSEYLDMKSLLQKRRKTEPSLLPRDEKQMGSLTHDKSNIEPRTRMNTTTKDLSTTKKRKDSPSAPSKLGHPKAKISSNMVSSYPPPSNDEGPRVRHGSTKIRRRSPVFTSSDEELTVSNRVSSHSSSHTTPSTMSHSHMPSKLGSRTTSRSVTTNHTALRERYSTAYVEYLTSLQKLVMQRRMVDQMLRTSDSGSVGSVTDSDSEVGLLHPEELARLAADHRKRHEELVSIQQMFATSSR